MGGLYHRKPHAVSYSGRRSFAQCGGEEPPVQQAACRPGRLDPFLVFTQTPAGPWLGWVDEPRVARVALTRAVGRIIVDNTHIRLTAAQLATVH